MTLHQLDSAQSELYTLTALVAEWRNCLDSELTANGRRIAAVNAQYWRDLKFAAVPLRDELHRLILSIDRL